MSELPRHFRLIRDVDVSEVSGTGHVADGVVFSDGEAAVHWLGRWPTTTPHPEGLVSVEGIHGHGGSTRIVFLDEQDELRRENERLRRENADLARRLSAWESMAGDLDRCEHGRRRIDPCYGCPSGNKGNPHIGTVIGYTVHGYEIVVPPEDEREDPRAWKRRR
jgi:hypothetical protein